MILAQRAHWVLGVSTLVLAFAGPAAAQSGQATEQASPSTTQLEEIVVTSRRVQESLQDVPVAVSAFVAADLEKRTVSDIGDIGRFTPNTFVTRSPQGSSDANFSIRGLRQDDFIVAADPAVGIYIDGVYLGRTVGSALDALDLERVEVLRGPQGTLFGRNTIGGAVSITTVKPDNELGGSLQATVGSRDHYAIKGAINVPFVQDVFAGRASFSYRTQDGPGKSVYFPGQTAGDVDDFSGRVSFRLTPNDRFEAVLSGDYSQGRGTTRHTVNLGASTTAAPFPFFTFATNPALRTLPADINNDRSADPYLDFRSVDPVNDTDIYGVSLTMAFKLTDSVEIKSITAYRDLKAVSGQDYDATGYRSFDQVATTNQDQFSQELQINGALFDDQLTFATGFYYFTETFDQLLPMGFRQIGPRLANTTFINRQFREGKNKSYAGYAQGSFKVTDQFSVTAGIRYSVDDKDLVIENAFVNNLGLTVNFAPPGVPAPSIPNGGVFPAIPRTPVSDSFKSWTPRLGLEFKPSDDVLLYVQYSRGFKSGGFNGRPQAVASIVPFSPEKVDSFEGGVKAELFDRRLRANMAVYYMDYKNIQSVIQTGGTFVIVDAGARMYGFEGEFLAKPVENFTLGLNIGYNDAKYKNVAPGLPFASGNRLPLAPEWTINASAEYVIPADTIGDFSLRGEWIYTGDHFFQATNFPREFQKGYSVFNFRVGWTSEDDRFSAAVYLNNAFDKFFYTFGQDASAGFGPAYAFVSDPREWGLTFGVKF